MKINELLNDLIENKKRLKSAEDIVGENAFFNRHLLLGDIDMEVGEAIESVIRFWNQVDDENGIKPEYREPIKIYIDSYGGDLGATFTMIDAITMSRTPVWTINIGAAYSGGFFTFLAGTKRIAYPHASFLFHEGATATQGTSGQFENYASFYKRQLSELRNFVLDRTNISEEEYDSIRKDDVWYSTKDGVEKGFVDEICKEILN